MPSVSARIKVLIVGCGNMGISHAKACQKLPDFDVIGIVDNNGEKRELQSAALGNIKAYQELTPALTELKPDAVAICTYPDTHADIAMKAIESGCHVFVEKPIADNVKDAKKVIRFAQEMKRKIVVGYILRHHPAWIKFTEIARTLGKPLVMRMNLNQQSSDTKWETHKNIIKAMSPIVDCGVHYVDVMCQMTRSEPLYVSSVGARLSSEIWKDSFNYGQLQVTFKDGSVGWYEAGWGPMMSQVAFFVKDVVGPKGCVSIVEPLAMKNGGSSDINSHTQTKCLRVHYADLNDKRQFAKKDERYETGDEPDHDELCLREQKYFLRAIQEDLDLSEHLHDAVNSLRIVLAADESAKTGKTIHMV